MRVGVCVCEGAVRGRETLEEERVRVMVVRREDAGEGT